MANKTIPVATLLCIFTVALRWTPVASTCDFEREFYVFELDEDYPLDEPIQNAGSIPIQGSGIQDIAIIRDVGGFIQPGNFNKTGLTNVDILLKKSLTAILDKPEGTQLSFRLQCKPNDKETEVEINVKDVNNNAPKFDEDSYEFSISEYKCQGTNVNNANSIIVRDGDLKGAFGDVTVTIESIIPAEGNFSLQVEPDPSTRHGKFDVRIIANGKLKHLPQGYTLVLKATDGHEPTSDARTSVTIRIIDEDDQDPIFKSPLYSSQLYLQQTDASSKIQLKLKEDDTWTDFDVSSGFVLDKMSPGDIHAYDQDIGINTPLTYELLEGAWRDYFELAGTGTAPKIKIKKIDAVLARQDQVSLFLKTFQDDDATRQAHALVTITIQAPIDARQMFVQKVDILRRSKAMREVYTVNVSPGDQNLKLKGKDAEFFQLSDRSILIKESIPSSTTSYEIEIEVNNASPLRPVKNVIQVKFHVVDRLENQESLFRKSSNVLDVISDTKHGTLIYKINTTTEEVLMRTISLEPSSCWDYITFNNKSGEIVLQASIDNNATVCKLLVQGYLESSDVEDLTEVNVNFVQKMSPQPPLFKKSVFLADVMTDTPKGHLLLDVQDNGSDVEVNITDISPRCDGSFSIESTGEIILSEILNTDVEECILNITGTLRDRVENVKVGFTIVKVMRPYQPIFPKSVYFIDLPATTLPGQTVLQLTLLKENVSISLTGGDVDVFEIVESTSQLKTVLPINASRSNYSLQLEARTINHSEIDFTKINFQTVEIKRPLLPIFEKSEYLVEVNKCAKNGSRVFTVATVNDAAYVNITDGDVVFFNYDSGSGDILLTQPLQPRISYELHLEAFSHSSASRRDKTRIHFTVLPSDGCGIMNQSSYFVQVPEDRTSGDEVYILQANEDATFRITDGDEDYFAIDAKNGTIRLRRNLDTAAYQLQVSVQASAEIQKNVYIQVIFRVNMSRPKTIIFQKDVQNVDLPTDSEINSEVYTVPIIHISESKVSMRIANRQDVFSLNQLNGVVTILKQVEHNKTYVLEIIATITNPKEISDMTKVVFFGVQRLWNQVFTKSQYIVSMAECTGPGTEVFVVNVTRTPVSITMAGGDVDMFTLDSNSGAISLRAESAGPRQRFTLDLDATAENMSDRTTVIIQTVSTEMCALFDKELYIADIPRNTEFGQIVFTLRARREVSYEMTDLTEELYLNESTGTISAKSLLTKDMYNLVVKATLLSPPHTTQNVSVKLIVRSTSQFGERYFRKKQFFMKLETSLTREDFLLNVKPEESPPAKYSLLENESFFAIDNDGNITLNADIEALEASQYVLKIQATPISNYNVQDSIFDIEENQAVVVFSKDAPPKFTDSSPMYKIFLPSASFTDFTFDIKLKSYDKKEKFSITHQHPEGAVSVDHQSGTVSILMDVTSQPHWVSNVRICVQNGIGLNASLDLRIFKLGPSQIITLQSWFNTTEIRRKQAMIEKKLTEILNCTATKLIYYSNEENGQRNYNSYKVDRSRILAAAFRSTEAIPFNEVKDIFAKFSEEVNEVLGQHVLLEYEDVSMEVNQLGDGGLLIGVIILSVLLALIVVALLVSLLLSRLRLDLLERISPWKKERSQHFSSSPIDLDHRKVQPLRDCESTTEIEQSDPENTFTENISATNSPDLNSARLEFVETSFSHFPLSETSTEDFLEHEDSDATGNGYDNIAFSLADREATKPEDITSIVIPEVDYELRSTDLPEVDYELSNEDELEKNPGSVQQKTGVASLENTFLVEGRSNEDARKIQTGWKSILEELNSAGGNMSEVTESDSENLVKEQVFVQFFEDPSGNESMDRNSDETGSDIEDEPDYGDRKVVTFCETPEVIRL